MDLGSIRRHMDAVGSDGEHLGTVDRVDHVDHNLVTLRRNDPASGGQHLRLGQTTAASVGGDAVRLAVPAARARRSWRGEAGPPDRS